MIHFRLSKTMKGIAINMEENVTIDRALEILSYHPLLTRVESIPLLQAHNRICAEDMISLVDSPPFDNSSVDGWAVISSDDPMDRVEVSSVFAGDNIPLPLTSGQAFRIMTGAPIPENADALVMIEDGINGKARTNFIRFKGENIQRNSIALRKGSILNPSSLALLASVGHSKVPVYVKPKVSIIPTGNELITPGNQLNEGQIYESNSISLSALVDRAGGESIVINSVQDKLHDLREIFDQCSKTSDLIITSGGVSMGDRDFVRKLLIDEGQPLFWKVKMRPGGPPIFGIWKGTPVIGLPGNPVSSHIVFLNLIVPWLSHPDLFYRKIRVLLNSPLKGATNKVVFRRIDIEPRDQLVASTYTHQGSGNIQSMVVHNALSVLPPNTNGEIGDIIDALWLID